VFRNIGDYQSFEAIALIWIIEKFGYY